MNDAAGPGDSENRTTNDYDWIFSKSHAAGILCFIHDRGAVMVKDLLRICPNHRTLTRTLDRLMELGLVEMRIIESVHIAKIYTVTSKGGIAAELLDDVRTVVEER